MTTPKLTQKAAGYVTDTPKEGWNCSKCVKFQKDEVNNNSTCSQVEGTVHDNGWCGFIKVDIRKY